MKIAILGTRGIPNYYGGFEQFAENFSIFLAENNHSIFVYSSSLNPFKSNIYKNVNIIHCFDPENKIGIIGQFIYDLNCILDSRKRNFDIILQLGYTSNSIWSFLLPKKSIIITNLDGLEWKRTKYSKKIQLFLKLAEKLAVKNSDYLIADSIGIQKYIIQKYKKKPYYIAYGSNIFNNPKYEIISEFNLIIYKYHLIIARLEPENNIEMIIKGVLNSQTNLPLIIVGKYQDTKYGQSLYKSYNSKNIIFLGGIYQDNILNNLRYFSQIYFHGHSVGGTNPSLLEAMASNCFIFAHKNEFNIYILKNNAFYFDNKDQVSNLINKKYKSDYSHFMLNNKQEIKNCFSWDYINSKYLNFIEKCLKN